MHKVIQRFRNTFNGCIALFKKDTNFLIHLIIAFIVIIISFAIGITQVEWLFIISAIMIVFITEAVNTSIETAVDLVTRKRHPLAKITKDVSAFAVLLASIYALIVGFIIFIPYLF